MEKDKIFFGEAGLTTTSANYTANIAKEMYRGLEQELQAIVFYTTTVKLLDSSEINLIREGVTTVSDVKQKLQDIAQLKSLIAWLRESIKAKERLIKEAENTSYEDYGLEVPERPERAEYITEDDVIGMWGIKQRNRYYYLDTLCATIGQYIHPDGTFAKEREQLQKILHEPHKVSGSGRDTLLYNYTSSVPTSEIEDTFMDLQQTYRGYQAELNSLKHQVQEAVQLDQATKNGQYSLELQNWQGQMAVIDAVLKEKRHQATVAAQNLKIIIPDSLKPIYEKVQKVGK
jgi:hypothetical protein